MNCSGIVVVTGVSLFNILMTLISVATPGWMLIEDKANGNASALKIVGLWNDESKTLFYFTDNKDKSHFHALSHYAKIALVFFALFCPKFNASAQLDFIRNRS